MRSSLFILLVVLTTSANAQEKGLSFRNHYHPKKTWSTTLPVYAEIITPPGLSPLYDGILIGQTDSTLVMLRMDPKRKFSREEKQKLKANAKKIWREDTSLTRQERQMKCMMLMFNDTITVKKNKIHKIKFTKNKYSQPLLIITGSLAVASELAGTALLVSGGDKEQVGAAALILTGFILLNIERRIVTKKINMDRWDLNPGTTP
ncbi:MAG TPA: hypothetical protein VI112_02935 [Bacteroidia bacterium]|jgi:hypothetical protein